MKKRSIPLLILLLGLPAPPFNALAQEIIPSKIQRVTLFSNQALVSRETTVPIQKGLNEIRMGIDAVRVDIDSVSAKVFGKGELYGVQLKTVFLPEAPQENLRALEKKLRELEASRKTLVASGDVLENKQRFLGSVIEFSKTQVPQDMKTAFPKTDDLEKTLTFLGKNLDEIHQQKQALSQKIDLLDQEIRVVKKELAAVDGWGTKEKKVIEILFHGESAQVINIQADYLVNDAHWQPLYKAAVPLDSTSVALTLLARVQQKTGEDWQGVDLSISNVAPLSGAGLPDASPWILDVIRPMPRAALQKNRFSSDTAAVSMEAMEVAALEKVPAPEPSPAEFIDARTTETPISFEYHLPRKLDIPSVDKSTLLPLFTKKLSGEFLHYTVPKTAPQSFLIGRVAADTEILSGPMNVHFGPHFIGKTYLDDKKPGEFFELNLGIDRGVVVKREKVMDKVKETFFGALERNTIVREMAYQIRVENRKEKAVTINILDSIPVSRTDKIKVEELKIEPPPSQTNYQNKEGIQLWTLTIEPKAIREIDISFVLHYPKGEPVSGL